MLKFAKIVKIIEGKAQLAPEVPKKVLMKIEDGDSGATKCAMVVEIADTPALRTLGLAKRASLNKVSGMWFDCHGPFWMKDVEFPLDLCYLDEKGMVTEKVAMAKDKEGKTLYPRQKEASVQAIELPAGFCDKNGVKIGDFLVPLAKIR